MKPIARIAKIELGIMFYSPIAWFVSIVFLFQCGIAYTSNIQPYLTNQNLGGEYLKYLNFLTDRAFYGTNGLYLAILSKIYLYLPLLTMGLISREVSSGTIKLLYSSPITVKQIILGKYLAMISYCLVMILILALFSVTAIFTIQSADTGLIFSGLFGIFLLLCAYTAIGLFMSCLTSYQIVAAVSTLVVFTLLNFIGTIWQDKDFVRDLTYFFSLSGRTDNMMGGLISSKDVLYFLIVSGMFLVFSIIKLQSGRTSRSGFKNTLRYALVLAVVLIAGYVSSLPRFTLYYDATTDNIRTLTPNTQKVLKQIGDEPLEITSYINLLDQFYEFGEPSQRNRDLSRWEPYLRFKPNIKFNYVYYYDEPIDGYNNYARDYPGKSIKQIAQIFAAARKANLDNFKTPEEIRKIIDLRSEKNRYVMQVKFKGKKTFLRLFNDGAIFPGEAEITAALKRLTLKVPKIAFLAGEFERSKDKLGPTDYGGITSNIVFRHALINKGFDSETISLNDQDIPTDIVTLVIGDPRAKFTPTVLEKLQRYIDGGGNLLIAGEPGKQEILNPIIQPWGIEMMSGMFLQKSKNYKLNMVVPLLTKTAVSFSRDLKNIYDDSIGVSMPGVSGLIYSGKSPFVIRPLLMTDSLVSWHKKEIAVLDSAAIDYSPDNGDDNNSVPTMLALTRNVNGKEQRIVVSGDADFLSFGAMDRFPNENFIFNTQLFRWFTYGEFPIDDSRPAPKDIRLNLTSKGLSFLKILFIWVLPGLLIIFTTVLLIRRKRK